ncbi:MAG: hypothetical protein ACI8UQ_000882 [Bacteroidia bacterium]|jgi:hypothetical protein
MKKSIYNRIGGTLLTLALISVGAFAQKADSVITQGGANDVYYSFKNGITTEVDKSTWDIALNTAAFDASILINENAGVELYSYGTNVDEWDIVDTAGFAFQNIYNSSESWGNGAFVRLASGHPDYGWGTYNMGTHNVTGNRIFILKDRNDVYHQVVIENMSAAGEYTIKTADIGGGNTVTLDIDKKDAAFVGKNFVHFDLTAQKVLNNEPLRKDWDLLFTKYIDLVPTRTGDLLPYLVSGVKINKGYEVAERTSLPAASNDTNNLNWNTDITEIGSDWKSFDFASFSYLMTDSLAYFVKGDGGVVWKIDFTNYKGGSTGGYYFNIEQLRRSASVNGVQELTTRVYPNPSNGIFTVENKENDAVEVSLMTLTGKVLESYNLAPNSAMNIDATSVVSGIYILSIRSNDKLSTQRIVIK